MLYLLYNPTAGRGRAAKRIARVLELFEQSGRPFEVLTTNASGHGIELAKQTPPGASIVAIGGDGTVQEAARGIVEAEGFPAVPEGFVASRTLGVIPLGSGDDFAFARGIDRYDVERATEQVLSGSEHLVDLGVMNGRPFTNAFGIGFDAAVASEAVKAPFFLKGFASYLYAVGVSLRKLKAREFTVYVNRNLVYKGNALLVSTQNGPRTGGSFLFTPDARNDDGLLDIIVAGDFNRVGALRVLPEVLRGTHLSDPKITVFSGTEVHISVSEPVPGHLEGELLAPGTVYEARIVPKCLRVIH